MSCFDELKKVPEFREISESRLKEIADDLEEIQRQGFHDADARMSSYVRERRYHEDTGHFKSVDDELKFSELVALSLDQRFNDNPLEALVSKMGGTSRVARGSQNSVDARQKRIKTQWQNALVSKLDQAGILDAVKRGELDKDFAIEKHDLSNRGASVTENEQAFRYAAIIDGLQNEILDTMEDAGLPVRRLDNYIIRQNHDSIKVSEVDEDEWILFVAKRLDPKTFDGMKSTDEMEEFLRGAYRDIVNDEFTAVRDARDSVFLDKEFRSPHRKLFFKNGQSFFEYHQKFGKGTMLDAVMSQIDFSSRTIGLAEVFGVNPTQMYKRVKNQISINVLRNKKQKKAFDSSSAFADDLFLTVSGGNSIPVKNMFAKAAVNFRKLEDMALLGQASLASLSDYPNMIGQIKAATGESVFSIMKDITVDFMRVVPRNKRREAARMVGAEIEDLLGEEINRFHVDFETNKDGLMSRLHRTFMTISGLKDQAASARVAGALKVARLLGRDSKLSFSQLNDRVRFNMQRYNIDETMWDVIRQARIKDFRNFDALSIEKIDELPDSTFDKLAVERGFGLAKARREAKFSLQNFVNDIAELGSPIPTARTRARLLGSLNPNTLWGQVVASFAQFKSFPVRMFHALTRMATSNPKTASKNLREMLNARDMTAVSQHIAAMTAMGYVVLALKDVAAGKEPRSPLDSRVWVDSFLQSGAAGLAGDFFVGQTFSEYGVDSFGALSGPTIARAIDVSDLAFKLARGEASAGKTVRMLETLIPGQNLFYTRVAFDNLFKFNLYKALNPDALDRIEDRAMETQGLFGGEQDFIFNRPSEAPDPLGIEDAGRGALRAIQDARDLVKPK